jgi:hypothetical protein
MNVTLTVDGFADVRACLDVVPPEGARLFLSVDSDGAPPPGMYEVAAVLWRYHDIVLIRREQELSAVVRLVPMPLEWVADDNDGGRSLHLWLEPSDGPRSLLAEVHESGSWTVWGSNGMVADGECETWWEASEAAGRVLSLDVPVSQDLRLWIEREEA